VNAFKGLQTLYTNATSVTYSHDSVGILYIMLLHCALTKIVMSSLYSYYRFCIQYMMGTISYHTAALVEHRVFFSIRLPTQGTMHPQRFLDKVYH
jgi:hypothetical protein